MGKNIKRAYYGIVFLLVIIFVVMLIKDEYVGTGIGLVTTQILIYLSLGAIIISSVLYIMNNLQKSMKLIISAVAILILSAIFYGMSGGEVTDDYISHGLTTASQSKLVDMGMYLTLFLGAAAVVITVVSEAISMAKN